MEFGTTSNAKHLAKLHVVLFSVTTAWLHAVRRLVKDVLLTVYPFQTDFNGITGSYLRTPSQESPVYRKK